MPPNMLPHLVTPVGVVGDSSSGHESKDLEVASQRPKLDTGWFRKNGWYIVIGLIILYWVLKVFILG
jgi:hypothetical protein